MGHSAALEPLRGAAGDSGFAAFVWCARHWSSTMTWRSFVCAVVVAASGTFFIEFGGLGHGDFVIGLADDSKFSFSRQDIGTLPTTPCQDIGTLVRS